MGLIKRAIDQPGLLFALNRPDIFNMHNRKQIAFRIPQGDRLTGLKAAGF